VEANGTGLREFDPQRLEDDRRRTGKQEGGSAGPAGSSPMMRQCIVGLLLYLLGREVITLVTVYVTLIIKGYKTFQQVPTNLQPNVKTELEVLGLGTDGKPLPE
jgi:hypothetical protein